MLHLYIDRSIVQHMCSEGTSGCIGRGRLEKDQVACYQVGGEEVGRRGGLWTQ